MKKTLIIFFSAQFFLLFILGAAQGSQDINTNTGIYFKQTETHAATYTPSITMVFTNLVRISENGVRFNDIVFSSSPTNPTTIGMYLVTPKNVTFRANGSADAVSITIGGLNASTWYHIRRNNSEAGNYITDEDGSITYSYDLTSTYIWEVLEGTRSVDDDTSRGYAPSPDEEDGEEDEEENLGPDRIKREEASQTMGLIFLVLIFITTSVIVYRGGVKGKTEEVWDQKKAAAANRRQNT